MGCLSKITFYSADQAASLPTCGEMPAQPITQIRTGRQRFKEVACGIVGAVTIAGDEEDDRSTAMGSGIDPRLIMVEKLSVPIADLLNKTQLFGSISEGVAWDALDGQITKIRKIGKALEILIDPAKAMPEGVR